MGYHCNARLVWECSRWQKPTIVWPAGNQTGFGYPMMTCRRCRRAARWRGWGVRVLARPWVILAAAILAGIGGGIIAGLPGVAAGSIIGAGLASAEEWLL